VVGILFLALSVSTALGQEKTDPKEIVTGVAHIALGHAYASVRVNGQEWETSFFENDGKTLILPGLDRTVDNTLHLVPMEEEFRFTDLVLKPKDWKLKRVDRKTRQWQLHKKLKFHKWKKGEKEAWEKAQQKAEEEDNDPAAKPAPAPKPDTSKPAPAPKPSGTH